MIYYHPMKFFSLLLEKEEGERETLMQERSIDWLLPPIPSRPGDQTHNLCLFPDWELNPQPFCYRWHSNLLSCTGQGYYFLILQKREYCISLFMQYFYFSKIFIVYTFLNCTICLYYIINYIQVIYHITYFHESFLPLGLPPCAHHLTFTKYNDCFLGLIPKTLPRKLLHCSV